MKKHLRSAQVIGGLTLVSRILGLVRDMLCAALLGAGLLWDAFVLGWTIPNLFRKLFGEGALSSAFIPIFSKVKESKGTDHAFRFTRITLTYFGVMLMGMVVLFYLFGVPLYWKMKGGEKFTLVLEILFFLFPYLLFICLSAVCGGTLNSLGKFALPATLPVVLNVVWIGSLLVGTWLFSDLFHRVLFMSGCLLFGGMVQFGLVLWGLRKTGMPLVPVWAPREENLLEVKKLMVPVILGLAALQINVLFDQLIAEFMVPGDGAVSALYYGNRLIQFPMAMLGIAISTAIFPSLSQQVVSGDQESFQKTLRWAMGITLFVALPATLGLMALADPTVSLLFKRGSFSAQAGERTTQVLFYYCPSVFFYSLVHVLTRAFYAHQDTSSPVKIATFMVGVNLVLNFSLVSFLQEAGLALATSVSSGLNLLALWVLFVRKYSAFSLRDLLVPLLRSLFCGLVMVSGVLYLLHLWPYHPGTLHQILRLFSLLLAGVLIYVVLAFLSGAQEVREIWNSFRK